MTNFVFVEIDDDSVLGNTDVVSTDSDSENDQNEEHRNVCMEEYYSLKAENNKLIEKNQS